MSLLAARHCLGSIYQVKCFLGGPLAYPFACVVLFIFGCVPYSCEVGSFNHSINYALTESPLASSNLPISTLSVHLSRLQVGR